MADWFANLMRKGRSRVRRGTEGARVAGEESAGRRADARDERHEAVVRTLRDREGDERAAREKRASGYGHAVASAPPPASDAPAPSFPTRLYRFGTKVPCRATPEARALLDQVASRYSGGTVTFRQAAGGRQAVMVAGAAGGEATQIGWVEHCVQTDPKLCNVRDQGLAVETDGDAMLVLRFLYPPTPVRMSCARHSDEASDEMTWVDFSEIRPALDIRPSEEASPPPLVMVTRPEAEMLSAAGSRDYEAFYTRFKLEVQAGIWSALSGVLSSSPGSARHGGAYYTVVRDADTTEGRIYQRTVDDRGEVVDIGFDRTYDASAAADALLLHLAGDILVDFADIYLTLQGLGSGDAYFLKEEFFALVRRFWSSTQSLSCTYGSEYAAVVRMSLRTAPTPAQAGLLKADWTNLRQLLVDRYGEGGRDASDLAEQPARRLPIPPLSWPFASIPPGEINLGLRLVYRQEWRNLGDQRGEVVRTIPLAPKQVMRVSTRGGRRTRNLGEVVEEAAKAVARAMKWPLEVEGSINTGVHGLAARTELGLEAERRESSRGASARFSGLMRRAVSGKREETGVTLCTEGEEGFEPSAATELLNPTDDDAVTYVISRVQSRYEVLTRLAEIQNVVMVAEALPTPAEINLSWVERHDWILAKVLLDESFRDALSSISQDARPTGASLSAWDPRGAHEKTIERVDTFSGAVDVRPDSVHMVGEWKEGYRETVFEREGRYLDPADRLPSDAELEAKRDRLYDHIRANILHYQRAIWQQEDPQQRSMRYRKSGRKVPLEWRFEIEAGGALTIDELASRLAATNVDGQFVAYSGGREADLDELIDPAGPIGYYGNYAIYLMRPEFASGDLFTMLHFFKSPYLWPGRERGGPEVADPVQIQVSEEPAVAAVSDQVLEQYRDEMVSFVPELRQELDRARREVEDGTDPLAVDRVGREPGLLRRHFGEYVFRRERSRRISLDTDRLLFEVVRESGSGIERLKRSPRGAELLEAPEGKERLPAETGGGAGLLPAAGDPDAEPGWAIVAPGDRTLVLGLAARAGVSRSLEPAAGGVIASGEGARTQRLSAGAGAAPAALQASAPAILARLDGRELPRLAPRSAAAPPREREPGRAIVARADAPLTLALVARAPGTLDPAGDRGIAARADAPRIPGPLARAAPPRTCDPTVEWVIPPGNRGPTEELVAGRGAAQPRAAAAEWRIRAQDDARLTPNPVAG